MSEPDAKTVSREGILTAAKLGAALGYERQFPEADLRELGDGMFVVMARATHDGFYRCQAHLRLQDQLTVDLDGDGMTLGLGDAVIVDVPASLYDSWPSVHDALETGTRVIKARPNYVQRFPER